MVSGAYKGSGTRFKLICMYSPEFAESTWTTTVLTTHATEEEAFAAEALLVPLVSLMNPWVINDTEGGRRGKYRNRNTLVKQINSERRRVSRSERAERAKLKKQETADKIKSLKRQLKEKTHE